jgi:glycosyl transferase family 25
MYHPSEFNYEEIIINYENYDDIYIEQIFNSYRNFYKKLSPGSVSLILKHIHCWKKQIDNNIDYCLILEDDVEIPENFKNLLDNIYLEMISDKSIGLTMVGTSFNMVTPNKINEKLIYCHPLQKTRCTHAYFINKETAKILIDNFKPINLPIDFKMNEIIQKKNIKVSWYEPGLKQIIYDEN